MTALPGITPAIALQMRGLHKRYGDQEVVCGVDLRIFRCSSSLGSRLPSLGLTVNALASGYDSFSYYLTLVLTPMMMLSGVFFPVEQLPDPIQLVAALLPLHHAVQLVRPLLSGALPAALLLHVAVLGGYAALGFYVATVLTRKRLLS